MEPTNLKYKFEKSLLTALQNGSFQHGGLGFRLAVNPNEQIPQGQGILC
jgi:hypothetical protein